MTKMLAAPVLPLVGRLVNQRSEGMARPAASSSRWISGRKCSEL
jgi:hypothetical protein